MLDALLRQPATTYRGVHYAAHEARMIPRSSQHPRVPFAIAATGPRGMRLAATYASVWVTTGDPSDPSNLDAADGAALVERQTAALDRACEEVGRDPATIDRMVVTGNLLSPCIESRDTFRAAVERYRAVGVTDLVIHWPRADGPYAGSLDTFEAIITAQVASS